MRQYRNQTTISTKLVEIENPANHTTIFWERQGVANLGMGQSGGGPLAPQVPRPFWSIGRSFRLASGPPDSVFSTPRLTGAGVGGMMGRLVKFHY